MTETSVRPSTKPQNTPKSDEPRAWNVVLIDDNDHSYDYVIKMLRKLFGHDPIKAFRIAEMVDTQGRAVCLTTHKEHAELKRDQIHAFGPDPSIMRCKGSMSAVIEPADCGGDDDDRAPGSDD